MLEVSRTEYQGPRLQVCFFLFLEGNLSWKFLADFPLHLIVHNGIVFSLLDQLL